MHGYPEADCDYPTSPSTPPHPPTPCLNPSLSNKPAMIINQRHRFLFFFQPNFKSKSRRVPIPPLFTLLLLLIFCVCVFWLPLVLWHLRRICSIVLSSVRASRHGSGASHTNREPIPFESFCKHSSPRCSWARTKTESAFFCLFPEDQIPHGFPTIDMGPQLKVVEKTRTATMLCAASGNPDPEISWFKDMLPVDISSSNGRIKQLRSGTIAFDPTPMVYSTRHTHNVNRASGGRQTPKTRGWCEHTKGLSRHVRPNGFCFIPNNMKSSSQSLSPW